MSHIYAPAKYVARVDFMENDIQRATFFFLAVFITLLHFVASYFSVWYLLNLYYYYLTLYSLATTIFIFNLINRCIPNKYCYLIYIDLV